MVAQSDHDALKVLNSQMRRIDLLCKLVGPMGIALLDGYSTELAIAVNFGMNLLSVGFEYFAIAWVYYDYPQLQEPKLDPADLPVRTGGLVGSMRTALATLGNDTLRYCTHETFLPSVAGTLLYFNVLSFGGQMVTYLLSSGYDSTSIGITRTVSVLAEVMSTWVAPKLMTAIGVTRAGIWSSWWQLTTLVVGVAVFLNFTDHSPVSASGLVSGTILSRMGLWSFDLCSQIIVQDVSTTAHLISLTPQEVEPEFRGVFSSMESAFQNVFELLLFGSTIIFSRPNQFKYPALMSVLMVFASNFCYTIYVRRRRGHLLHPEKLCGSCIKREGHGYERVQSSDL